MVQVTYAKSHTSIPRPAVLRTAPTQSRPMSYLSDMSSWGRTNQPSTQRIQPRPACSQKIVRHEALDWLRIPPGRQTFSQKANITLNGTHTENHADDVTDGLTRTEDGEGSIL